MIEHLQAQNRTFQLPTTPLCDAEMVSSAPPLYYLSRRHARASVPRMNSCMLLNAAGKHLVIATVSVNLKVCGKWRSMGMLCGTSMSGF